MKTLRNQRQGGCETYVCERCGRTGGNPKRFVWVGDGRSGVDWGSVPYCPECVRYAAGSVTWRKP